MTEKPPVKMIATDIDGTMLRDDGSLSSRVKSAIGAALDAGIPVVPATGRPYTIARDVISASELDDYWVFANGAITRHLGRDELVRGYWLDPDLALSLIDDLRGRLSGAGFAVEFEHDIAFEPSFAKVVPIPPDTPADEDITEAINRAVAGGARIQKLLAFDPEVTIDRLYGLVSDVVGSRAHPCHSGLHFVELGQEQVTKATALDLLAADLGITPEEVAVFGDNQNDLQMLEWGGRSFAMANATEDAKRLADEVIESNEEDGLAVKVEQLLEELG